MRKKTAEEAYKTDITRNITTKKLKYSKTNYIDGTIANGARSPILLSFEKYRPPRHEINETSRKKLYRKNSSVIVLPV